MFRHILIPTDGSKLSAKGVKAGVKLAKALGAKKALAAVEIEAQAARVPCSTRFVTQDQPWKAILRAARSSKCDAIVMASHGRGGVGGLILGSETTRVLASSKIPVLVIR